MLIALVPLVVMLVGLFVWFAVTGPPKPWGEFGKILFFVGLFVLVMTMASRTWTIG